MINERDIAEKFTAIWKQHFPLLTPNFMRVFNESYVRSINAKPVPITVSMRFDLISEVAFNLSEVSIKKKLTPAKYILNKRNFQNLIQQTFDSMWQTDSLKLQKALLAPAEIEEAWKLSNNIVQFVKSTKAENVYFKPKLRGFGFIPDLVADLLVDDTLYEIKTANRNFKSNDLKQLIIYLALQQVSNGDSWKYAGLYNPRKGTYCRFRVRDLIHNISGDLSPSETFENFLNSLVRDVQLDTKF